VGISEFAAQRRPSSSLPFKGRGEGVGMGVDCTARLRPHPIPALPLEGKGGSTRLARGFRSSKRALSTRTRITPVSSSLTLCVSISMFEVTAGGKNEL